MASETTQQTCTADSGTCATCGHGRDGHRDEYGGICVGCPCGAYVPRPCGAALVVCPQCRHLHAQEGGPLTECGSTEPYEGLAKALHWCECRAPLVCERGHVAEEADRG